MGVFATKLLGWTVMFGVPAFIAAYVVVPGFRDQINKLIAGTKPIKWQWRAHITNQG